MQTLSSHSHQGSLSSHPDSTCGPTLFPQFTSTKSNVSIQNGSVQNGSAQQGGSRSSVVFSPAQSTSYLQVGRTTSQNNLDESNSKSTTSWFNYERAKVVRAQSMNSSAAKSPSLTHDTDSRASRVTRMSAPKERVEPLPPPPSDADASPTVCQRLLSVRVITAGMSLLLIALTAAILLAVTFTFSINSAQEIATQHVSVIASKAKSDIESYFNIPVNYLDAWQYALSKGVITLPSDEPTYPSDDWTTLWLERLVGPIAASDFTFQYAIFGFEDGNAMLCVNLPGAEFRCQIYAWGYRNASNPNEFSNLTDIDYFKANYTVTNVSSRPDVYNPTTRTWYKQGSTAPHKKAWSNAFLSTVPTLPCITVSAGIYNDTGAFLGVASIFLNMNTIASFLSELLSVKNTVSFLIDNQDMLLATTYHLPVMTTTEIASGTTGALASNCLRSDTANGASLSVMSCRERADSYGYAPLRELARADPGYVAQGIANHVGVRELDGRRYFVAVIPISTAKADGMGWRFALFLPEDEVIAGIVRGRDIAIYICVAVVVVAAAASLIVITLLLRPLDAVAERMYRVAMMQDVDEATDATNSSLLEISTIQTAFNTMTAELAKIKSFLPQSVLEQLYGGMSDDEEGDLESIAGTHITSTDVAHQSRRASGKASTGHLRTADGSVVTGSSGGLCAPALNTTVRLSNRKVTMLSLNVLQFHRYMTECNTDHLVQQHGHIVKAVADACAEFRGVMDGFQGDRFTISFNAVTHAGNHAVLAAHAARAVCEAVWNRTSLTVSSGLASGFAMVGNMGSATTKRFTVLSPVVSSAVLLERLSKRYCSEEPVTLTAGGALQDLDAMFELLTLDAIMMPVAKGRAKRTRLCAIMGVKEASADEWMYEMQEGTKNSKYGAANEAFRLFLEGMVTDAGATAKAHLEANDAGETAAEGRLLVRSVLLHINDLVEQATKQGSTEEDATRFGLSYFNPIADYYMQCAMPLPHEGGDVNK